MISKITKIISFALLLTQTVYAQDDEQVLVPDTVRVGIKAVVPFVIDNADSVYSGISILFWEKVADDLDWAYKYKLYPTVEGLLQAVESKEVDLAVGALTITDEREAKLDFTHSRNLIVVALVLVVGLGISGVGGVQVSESFNLSGLFLAALVGIISNKVLPEEV